jgi:hypothetical protein
MIPNTNTNIDSLLGQDSQYFSLKNLLLVIGISVFTLALYTPSLTYNFVYDDSAVLTQNSFVHEGVHGLSKIWTSSYFKGFNEQIEARAYRPFSLTTLALQYQFSALNPVPYHLFNVCLYCLIIVLVFYFVSLLLKNKQNIAPVIVALFFALHPIHVEVVANVKSRDTMLGLAGFLLAACFFMKFIDSKKWYWFLVSLLAYLTGLFSKEEVLTTMAIFPLMLYFFRDAGIRNIITRSLPYLLCVVFYLMIRSNILGGLNEGVILTPLDNSLLAADNQPQRLASTIFVSGHFLYKIFLPYPLISDYSYSTIPLTGWQDWRVYAALFVIILLCTFSIYGLIKRKFWAFSLLFYFITVSIFLSILTPNVSVYNDRFLFTPVLGFCMLAGWGLSKWVIPGKPVNGFLISNQRNFHLITIVGLLCLQGIITISAELPDWKDRFSLFRADLKHAPNNARLLKNHGGSLVRLAIKAQLAAPYQAKRNAKEATTVLKRAVNIYPEMPSAWIYLGIAQMLNGTLDEAENSFHQALRQSPGNYYALTNLANLYFRKSKFKDCINTLNQIKDSNKKMSDFQVLYQAYMLLGDTSKAATILPKGAIQGKY